MRNWLVHYQFCWQVGLSGLNCKSENPNNKVHLIKINSDLNRKLPATGCFGEEYGTPGASAGGEQ
jgi:hypothetical protein